MIDQVNPTSLSKESTFYDALKQNQFFKLICGGSFTDQSAIERLVKAYTLAGCDCIDIAPDKAVLSVVKNVFHSLPDDVKKPTVMVSVPLDPDPHFRKIELMEPDCILCGACVPVCPTDAIGMNVEALDIDQPRCYGCNRCVDVCPTEALKLNPFLLEKDVTEIFSDPLVGAVEIHTAHADPLMLKAFINQYQYVLHNKWVAFCFRPDDVNTENWIDSVKLLKEKFQNRVLLQIDGKPMSGSSDPRASLPSIQSARQVYRVLKDHSIDIPITISGGINQFTAAYLSESENSFIAGCGMGTMARNAVWDFINSVEQTEEGLNTAIKQSKKMIVLFKKHKKSSIIESEDTKTKV